MNLVDLKPNDKFKSVTISPNILAELFFLLPDELKKEAAFSGAALLISGIFKMYRAGVRG